MKFPKPKKPNRKKIVKLLDKEISRIVIARDGACVTCGSREKLGAGHLFSRTYYSTRWDLENVFCQCWPCNYRHEFDWKPFQDWYTGKFGPSRLESTYIKWKTVRKFKDVELVELLELLKKK